MEGVCIGSWLVAGGGGGVVLPFLNENQLMRFFFNSFFVLFVFFCQTDRKVEKANNLYIREISVMDTVHLVKPGFQRRYGGDGNYPADFPVRSK